MHVCVCVGQKSMSDVQDYPIPCLLILELSLNTALTNCLNRLTKELQGPLIQHPSSTWLRDMLFHSVGTLTQILMLLGKHFMYGLSHLSISN